MDPKVVISVDTLETAESLQMAYNRLFVSSVKVSEGESYSLAQPYPQRFVPSFASDNTESTAPYKG